MKQTMPKLSMSDDVLKLNPELAGKAPLSLNRKRPRSDQFRSQLEADYAAELTARGLHWLYEPVTFHLPGGVGYTPDFAILDHPLTFVEVKGSMRQKNARDSRTRFKVCAGLWPAFRWKWVTRVDGYWHEIDHLIKEYSK